MNEREYIEDLVSHADDTVHFLSNERKQERERSVCAALLRCLGIEFSPAEIVSSIIEPPDVIFQEGQFEVVLILDVGRKMHGEWKAKSVRWRHAKSLDDVSEPPTTPAPISYGAVSDMVTSELTRKTMRYNQNARANLDALVYVNLVGKFLDIDSPLPSLDPICSQGWRSVSILMDPYGLVLCAEPSAPNFLRDLVGLSRRE